MPTPRRNDPQTILAHHIARLNKAWKVVPDVRNDIAERIEDASLPDIAERIRRDAETIYRSATIRRHGSGNAARSELHAIAIRLDQWRAHHETTRPATRTGGAA